MNFNAESRHERANGPGKQANVERRLAGRYPKLDTRGRAALCAFSKSMKREIHDHKVNNCNEAIDIHVLDEPGQGGASHVYGIAFVSGTPDMDDDKRDTVQTLIQFQNGPIKEFGVNGITQEALIAICIDRLRSFQAGQYSCRENAVALTHLETAQMWLMKRTRDRMARGVEGTNQK